MRIGDVEEGDEQEEEADDGEPLGGLSELCWCPHLQISWSILGDLAGLSGAILAGVDQNRGGLLTALSLWSPSNRFLGPSCGTLGALIGALGAVLEPSWAPKRCTLGPSWSHDLASKAHQKQKEEGSGLGMMLGSLGF